MARSANHLFVAALAALFCLGQVAHAAQASQAPAQTSTAQEAAPATTEKAHGPMPVELTKALDSKKLKEGDQVTGRINVELRTSAGETIPAGSKVTGHVTVAKARSKGDQQAELGIAFDQVTTPAGKTVAIKSVLQAVGPSLTSRPTPAAALPPSSDPTAMARSQTGMDAGTVPTPQPPLSPPTAPPVPVLTGQSKGVVGIRNLELGENSVLFSTGKEVRLDSGTQMIIQVEIE